MKFFLAFVLAICLMICAPVAGAQRHRSSQKSHGKSVASLRNKLKDLRHQKKVLQNKLHMNKTMTHQTLQEIAEVDEQLNNVQDALQTTTEQLADSRVQQKQVTGELKVATDKLTVVKGEVRARLRRIYASGPTSTLSVLLGSHTGGELASRSETMAEIAKSDRKIFEEYKTLRGEVANRKAAADALVVKVTDLEQQQRSEQHQLQVAKEQKGEKIQELEAQRGELEEAIAQFEQDENELTSQINAFVSRLNAAGKSLPAFAGGFLRPVPGAITSGFGYRYHPILHKTRLHAGVDFHAPTGTPVHAAASGIVAWSRYMRGFGNVVSIAHGSDISTVYGHLSQRYVVVGQHVKKGDVIGASGATGLATGPHLHFEIRVHAKPVNQIGFRSGIH